MQIKGFCANPKLANNDSGKTSQLGELTTYARTFSKDIGIYTNDNYPNIELDVFSARNEDSTPVLVIKPAYIETILEIASWVYSGTTKLLDASEYGVELHNEFFNKIKNVEASNIIQAGGIAAPEKLTFKLENAEDIEIKLWFSAQAMEKEYDEYDIIVVHPLDNIDHLFKPIADLRKELDSVTITSQIEKIQELKNKNPETVLRAETIQYINAEDPSITLDLVWYVAIYGPNGDNVDAIKQAIIDAIMRDSAEPEASWKNILPYLFKTTRMYVLPRWDRMSLPSRLDNVGIYSPISHVQEAISYAKACLGTIITTKHIEDNLEITHHKYRSISLLACGGEDNALDKFKLSDYISDYIAEPSTSQDFNRQVEYTRNWTITMEELLILAENLSINVDLPFGVRKVTMGDVTYLSKRIGNVEWMIAVREK